MSSADLSLNAFADWNRALLEAAGVTLQIAAGAFVLGIGIGLAGAAAKLSGYPALVRLANLYTLICRAVPELLLILLLFYAGSDLINLLFGLFGRQVSIDGFTAAVLVLGIVQGAYATEIIRGAFLAIPHGQIEAAKAFALPRRLIFQRVILPAMLPYALAGIANLWLVLIKDTSLISVAGYSELLLTAKQAAGSTKQYFIYYTLVAAYYFIITMVSTSLFRRVERRFKRWMPARSHA